MKWLLCLTIATTSHAAVDLKAGVSRVEITPSALMEMYGYANRKCGPASGTHDLGSMVSDNLRRDVASQLKIPLLFKLEKERHFDD